MKSRTKEFLHYLLWTFETAAQPSYRRITETFEGWAYRTGLDHQINRLVEKNYLAVDPGDLPAAGPPCPRRQTHRSWTTSGDRRTRPRRMLGPPMGRPMAHGVF